MEYLSLLPLFAYSLKQDSLPPLELRLQLCEHAWLVMWGWDQNFGPYDCEASTLNAEPSIQPPLYSSSSIMFFIVSWYFHIDFRNNLAICGEEY